MTARLDYMTLAAGGVKALFGVQGYLEHSGLTRQMRELVYLRVSQINGCAYCIDKHSRDLREGGMTVERLCLVPVWREAGELFSPQERAALAWAEVVTRVAETGIPDADFEAVSKHFQGKELSDLTIAISLMNALNRLGVGFRMTPASVKG